MNLIKIHLFFQIVFMGCSFATLYLIYFKFKATYDKNHDTFRIEFLVGPIAFLALILNHQFTFLEVCFKIKHHFIVLKIF